MCDCLYICMYSEALSDTRSLASTSKLARLLFIVGCSLSGPGGLCCHRIFSNPLVLHWLMASVAALRSNGG